MSATPVVVNKNNGPMGKQEWIRKAWPITLPPEVDITYARFRLLFPCFLVYTSHIVTFAFAFLFRVLGPLYLRCLQCIKRSADLDYEFDYVGLGFYTL